MSDNKDSENVGDCNNAAKGKTEPNNFVDNDFISLSDLVPIQEDHGASIFGKEGVEMLLGDDEDQLDLDKAPPLLFRASTSHKLCEDTTSNVCAKPPVLENASKDVAQGTISSSTDLCVPSNSETHDVPKCEDSLSENIVSTSKTLCVDAEIVSPKKRGRKPKKKRGRKSQTDKSLPKAPIPTLKKDQKQKDKTIEVTRRSARFSMKKDCDSLLNILQDTSPSQPNIDSNIIVGSATQDMSFKENADDVDSLTNISNYINDTNVDNHNQTPVLNDNLGNSQTESLSLKNMSPSVSLQPNVKEKSKRGRKRKTQINEAGKSKSEKDINTISFLPRENTIEWKNENHETRDKDTNISQQIDYSNKTISEEVSDDDELSLSHIKKLNSLKMTNDSNVVEIASTHNKNKSRRGRKRKISQTQSADLNESDDLLHSNLTNINESEQTHLKDEVSYDTLIDVLDNESYIEITPTSTLKKSKKKPQKSEKAGAASIDEMDIDNTIGESLLLVDQSVTVINEITTSDDSVSIVPSVTELAEHNVPQVGEEIVISEAVSDISNENRPEKDAPINNSVGVVSKESDERTKKRTSKKAIMDDYEYDIDKAISHISKPGELIEDTLYSEDGRPLRRKARQKHYDENSDEDPYANVEISDDESDAEYVPDNNLIVESSKKKSKLNKTLEAPVTAINDELNDLTCIDLDDDVENNLEASVIKVKYANHKSPPPGFSEILGNKSLGAGLEIKKVIPKDGSQLPPMKIPIILNKCHIDTQTNIIKYQSTSAQTVGPESFKLKRNVLLTNEQKVAATDFLTKILNTTNELGNLMTQKSGEFISKKINPEFIKTTAKFDFCAQKAFLLLKVARDNIDLLEENLNKKYEEFLSSNNLMSSFERDKTITPKQPEATSDSDCEIVEESIPENKPKTNPKTVFLNKELSIKIAKKPTTEPIKKPTPTQKQVNPKTPNKVHSVWINDSIMVKKIKPSDSFLAKDSRNDKPPDKIMEAQVNFFYTLYYSNYICRQTLSLKCLYHNSHNTRITFKYCDVQAPVLHTDFDEHAYNLMKTPCLEPINKKIVISAMNIAESITWLYNITFIDRPLIQIARQYVINDVESRQTLSTNIDIGEESNKLKKNLQFNIEAVNVSQSDKSLSIITEAQVKQFFDNYYSDVCRKSNFSESLHYNMFKSRFTYSYPRVEVPVLHTASIVNEEFNKEMRYHENYFFLDSIIKAPNLTKTPSTLCFDTICGNTVTSATMYGKHILKNNDKGRQESVNKFDFECASNKAKTLQKLSIETVKYSQIYKPVNTITEAQIKQFFDNYNLNNIFTCHTRIPCNYFSVEAPLLKTNKDIREENFIEVIEDDNNHSFNELNAITKVKQEPKVTDTLSTLCLKTKIKKNEDVTRNCDENNMFNPRTLLQFALQSDMNNVIGGEESHFNICKKTVVNLNKINCENISCKPTISQKLSVGAVKDRQSDKPLNNITETQVKLFFDNYRLNNICTQLMSPEWLEYDTHNSRITCNYFSVEAPVLHTDIDVHADISEDNFIEINDEDNNHQTFNEGCFFLGVSNQDVQQQPKVTKTLLTLCLETLNKIFHNSVAICDKNVTSNPRSLFQLALECVVNNVERRQDSYTNIGKTTMMNLNKSIFQNSKANTLLQLSIAAINDSIHSTHIINDENYEFDFNFHNPRTLLQLCLQVVRHNITSDIPEWNLLQSPMQYYLSQDAAEYMTANTPMNLKHLCFMRMSEIIGSFKGCDEKHNDLYYANTKPQFVQSLLCLCLETIHSSFYPQKYKVNEYIERFNVKRLPPLDMISNELCTSTSKVVEVSKVTLNNPKSLASLSLDIIGNSLYKDNNHFNLVIENVVTIENDEFMKPIIFPHITGADNDDYHSPLHNGIDQTIKSNAKTLSSLCLEIISHSLNINNNRSIDNNVYPGSFHNGIEQTIKYNAKTLSSLCLEIISHSLNINNDRSIDNNVYPGYLHNVIEQTVKTNAKTLSSLCLEIILHNLNVNNDRFTPTQPLKLLSLEIDQPVDKTKQNIVKTLSSLSLDIILENLYRDSFPNLVIENVSSILNDRFLEPNVYPTKTEVIDDIYDNNAYGDDLFDEVEENWHSNIELGDLRSCTEPIREENSANINNKLETQNEAPSFVHVKLEVEENQDININKIKQEAPDYLNQFLENNEKEIKNELLGELDINNIESINQPVDSFEDFIRNNPYAQGVISGSFEQSIQRQYELDNMSSDYDSDTGMSLLVPMAYQPVEIRPNGEVIYKSTEGDKNKGKKKGKRGRKKKVLAKECDKNTTEEQLKNITKKLKDKINDKEEETMSSDSEMNFSLKKTLEQDSNLKPDNDTESVEEELYKFSNETPEIQCNSVDSTQNISLDKRKKRLRPRKYDKKSESCVEDDSANVDNVTCKTVNKKAKLEINDQLIESEPLDANKEVGDKESMTDSEMKSLKVHEKGAELSTDPEKLKFTQRNDWHCYRADINDVKLYHPCSVMLEKLPEDFVNTYLKYTMMSNNEVEYDDEDMEIMRLTNLNNLNRLTRINDGGKVKPPREKRSANNKKKDGDDENGDYDYDYPEMEPSDEESPSKEKQPDSLPQYNFDDDLARNLLLAEEKSDDDAKNYLQIEISVDNDGEVKTTERRVPPGPKSKKKRFVEYGPVVLTVDKMMKKELEMLHAPVTLDDLKPKTSPNAVDSKEDLKIKLKLTPSNPVRHSPRKKHNILKDDSSSEEEKLWVNTKSKLLKRMEKKILMNKSVDDERRAKIVNEYLERNSAMPSTSGKRRRLLGRKRREREILLRQMDEAGNSLNALVGKKGGSYSKGRKNIRKVLDKKSLAKSTVRANMEEFERKKRINNTQIRLRQIFNHSDAVNVVVINDELCLEFDFETSKPTVTVHKFFTQVMKDHQYEGVKFLWDACFESLAHIKAGSPGGGCILAHCMGLGKTLQVLALLHTVLTHPQVGIQRVLVCCPLSTVLNWVDEINKWMGPITNEIKVFELSKLKKIYERAYQLEDWYKNGGIFIIGYELFRSLSTIDPEFDEVRPTIVEKLRRALLDPGPDIIVCDEGHLLKNDTSVLAIAMSRVKTKRRIVLTGTPMQNNLREYFCMVNFIKPNLLGTYTEYSNRFENPIMNGQHRDSSIADIKLMKARTFILHKVLEGCLQRQEASVLYPYLPRKYEYTVFISLTKCQSSLYKHYLDEFSRQSKQSILKDFHVLQKIWSHPLVLHNFLVKRGDEVERDIKLEDDLAREDLGADRDIKPLAEEVWWLQHLEDGDMLNTLEASNKFDTLFRILDECVKVNDKVLIFSTSLFTMDALEFFLKKIKNWSLGYEYYRLDGSVPPEVRQKWCREFNAENNTKTKLFLISTRAGCLGLNMTGANRVILFDTSWNPAHDIQSIFRVYRFGQKKDCYIYRLVAMGTMEQKIYERSVTKQAVACRVVDEQEIDRHYNMADLGELYRFDESGSGIAGGLAANISDLVLLRVARHPTAFYSVHEHDSLLRDTCEQQLPEDERQEAWDQFQKEQTDKHNLSTAEALMLAIKGPPAERKQKAKKQPDSIKRISLKVSENDEVVVEQQTNYNDDIIVPETITPDQNVVTEEQPDLDNDIINKIASILIKHKLDKPDADKTLSGVASIVSTLISEREPAKLKTRGKKKTEDVALAESILKVLQKHVGDDPTVDPQPSTSKANIEISNETPRPMRKCKRKTAINIFDDDTSNTQSLEIESQPLLPKKKRKTVTPQESMNDIRNEPQKPPEESKNPEEYSKKPPEESKKPPEESKKDVNSKSKEINTQEESRRRLLQKIEVQSEIFEVSDDDDDVPLVVKETPKSKVKASCKPGNVQVIPEKELKPRKESELVVKEQAKATEVQEPCPLNPEILTNPNFAYIVANMYLSRNPDLTEHSSQLAAEYSIKSALNESEKTNKPITSGAIYDIAVKVLGKDTIKALWEKKVQTDETTIAVESISQTKPQPKYVVLKPSKTLASKNDAPQTPIISKVSNMRENQATQLNDGGEVLILPDNPQMPRATAKPVILRRTVRANKTQQFDMSSGNVLQLENASTNEPVAGTSQPVAFSTARPEELQFVTPSGQLVKLPWSRDQVPFVIPQGSVMPPGTFIPSKGYIPGSIVTSQASKMPTMLSQQGRVVMTSKVPGGPPVYVLQKMFVPPSQNPHNAVPLNIITSSTGERQFVISNSQVPHPQMTIHGDVNNKKDAVPVALIRSNFTPPKAGRGEQSTVRVTSQNPITPQNEAQPNVLTPSNEVNANTEQLESDTPVLKSLIAKRKIGPKSKVSKLNNPTNESIQLVPTDALPENVVPIRLIKAGNQSSIPEESILPDDTPTISLDSDDDDMPLIVTGSKPTITPVTTTMNTNPVPVKNITPNPMNYINIAPAPAKNIATAAKKNIAPAPLQNIAPAPAKNVAAVPATNVAAAPAKNVASATKNIATAAKKNIAPAPLQNIAPAPATNVAAAPAKKVATATKNISTAAKKNIAPAPLRNIAPAPTKTSTPTVATVKAVTKTPTTSGKYPSKEINKPPKETTTPNKAQEISEREKATNDLFDNVILIEPSDIPEVTTIVTPSAPVKVPKNPVLKITHEQTKAKAKPTSVKPQKAVKKKAPADSVMLGMVDLTDELEPTPSKKMKTSSSSSSKKPQPSTSSGKTTNSKTIKVNTTKGSTSSILKNKKVISDVHMSLRDFTLDDLEDIIELE